MKLAHQIVLCSAIFGLISAGAQAAKRKVPEQYPTIQAAVDASFDGDAIVVSKGTYAPFEVLNKQCLTIQGKSGAVIGDPAGAAIGTAISLRVADGFRIRGLTFVDASTGVSVENCYGGEIERCVFKGSLEGVVITGGSTNIKVRKNLLKNTVATAIVIGRGGDDNPSCLIEKNRLLGFDVGISVQDSQYTTIRRNKLRDGLSEGVMLAGSSHSLVDENNFSGVAYGVYSSGEGTQILRNKVREGMSGITMLTPGLYAIVLENVIRDQFTGIYVGGDHSLVGRNRTFDCSDSGFWINDFAELNEVFDNRMKRCSVGMGVMSIELNQIRANRSKDTYGTSGPLFLGPGAAAGNTFVGNFWD